MNHPSSPQRPSDPGHQRPRSAAGGGQPASREARGTGGERPWVWAADEAADEAAPQRRRMRVEAVLLVAQQPLSPRKLADLALLADATEARTLVRQLNQTYHRLGRAMRVELVAGGYRMMTRPALAPWLARLGHLPGAVRLSTPMMETLAVVAYRQPVSRARVEAVRGVACGELLRQLMDRNLIRIAGRSEELGRPYLYGTTKRFLQLFGLARLEDLPPIQWPVLQAETGEVDSPPTDSPPDSSTSIKEPVVSTTIAPTIADAVGDPTAVALVPQDPSERGPALDPPPVAIDDEEDEELFDDEDEDEDWDEDEDDDWDEEEDDEEDVEEDEELEDELDDEELDDELDDEQDDFEDDEWEEVDDEDEWDDEEEDEEWDDEEEDESAEDDEDWE